MKHLLFFILLGFIIPEAFPHEREIKVSLLTVSPRDREIYTIYGHTALRLQYDGNDAVLNWGTFDSNRRNFIYHFVRGETDYFLSAEPYSLFEQNYLASGAQIVEQTLNIPDSLKMAMLEEIRINLLPENVEYRYNYFFDNCTTRPRNLIERYCGGEIVYREHGDRIFTLRNLVHECTAPYPWMQFGIDLVISSGADSLISRRTELFLPEKLCRALAESVVRMPDGQVRPVVLSTERVMNRSAKQGNDSSADPASPLLNPLPVCCLVFFIFLIITVWAVKKRCSCRLPFAILFFVAGAAGCLVAFLMLFSSHPCVSPNWNILWLNPLYFIGAAGFATGKRCRLFDVYFVLNFVVLSAFILAWRWIPQAIDIAFLPLAGCLWLGAVAGIWRAQVQKK
jgi:hypothetical protein